MKQIEKMTIAELKEFAVKIDKPIPPKITKRANILAYLQEPKAFQPPVSKTPKQIQEERDKKASKIPLSESEKRELAALEKLARSGKTPGIDQMKKLRIFRIRKTITPLSAIEKRELEELKLAAEGAQLDGTNVSGLPDDERLDELKKRSELE